MTDLCDIISIDSITNIIKGEVNVMEELIKIVLVGLACPLLLPFVIDSTSQEVTEE